MLLEPLFHGRNGNLFPVAVPVHDAVEAHAHVREDITAQRNVCVQGAGSADAQDVQRLVLRLHFPGGEVYVGQGVQLRHDDVDVVRADAVGQHGDALAVVAAGYRNEFAGGVAEFHVLQVFGNHVHAAGVSHHDNIVCQFLRLDVDVENGTVGIDDEFGFRDSHNACGFKTQT